MNKKLVMIFWPYDSYPYFLSAVGNYDEVKGKYNIPSYQMFRSKEECLAIFPLEEGKKIKKEIDLLSLKYQEEKNNLKNKFDQKLDKVCAKYKLNNKHS